MVTDLEYYLDPVLIKKLDIMIRRCTTNKTKKDALLINEGAEGEGKTNSSLAESYYIKYNTGRPIHLFFKLKDMINFAKNTEKKIIIWDEPGLDSLSTDQQNKLNKNLIRLLMAVRIKRHFFIFNLTKFYKFPEYIVVDRCLGLVHMYSRKEVDPGRFVYIRKRNLERLFTAYRNGRKRLYKKLKSFRGSFPDLLNPKKEKFSKMGVCVNGIMNATLNDYEDEKNKAIGMIGEEEKKEVIVNQEKIKLKKLRYLISQIKIPIKTKEELALALQVDTKRIREWKNQIETTPKDTETLGKSGFEGAAASHI